MRTRTINMKSFLILASIVTAANAGVGRLTPAIEAEALRLWQRHCAGTSEGGTAGNTFIYCKKSRDTYEETLQHQVSLTPGPSAREQVIFVQPPQNHYRHSIIVTGGGGSAPKTVIYVKPSKASHDVNIDDRTIGLSSPQKPTLYFLKDHGESARGGFRGRLRRDDAATMIEESVSPGNEETNEEYKDAMGSASKTPVVYVLKNGNRN